MAQATKEFLSASVNGKPILVTATESTGTLIHTSVSGTTSKDEVWLYVTNISSSNVTLTIETDGAPMITTIAAQSGLTLILPGLPLNNGLAIRAYADTASTSYVSGFVNRIS